MNAVYFTDDERQQTKTLAHERNALKQSHGVSDHKKITKKKTSEEITYEGCLAELAVAKLLGVEVNTSVTIKGDGGYGDLRLPSGETISVKYSSKKDGVFALRSERLQEFADDYGVLVYPRYSQHPGRGMLVAGCISRQRFEERCRTVNLGHGNRLGVIPSDLEPIEILIRKVTEQRERGVPAGAAVPRRQTPSTRLQHPGTGSNNTAGGWRPVQP